MSAQQRFVKEQVAIIEHTQKNGMYCGDSDEIRDLCEKGVMALVGYKSFVPDPYFKITNKALASEFVANSRNHTQQ